MKLDKKGFTLIETLLAFMIYVQVIVLLISLYNQSILSSKKLIDKIEKVEKEEVILLEEYTLKELIEEVLH